MADDWAAVSQAVNQRMSELSLNQRELIERSQVSRATLVKFAAMRRNAAVVPARSKRSRSRWTGTPNTWPLSCAGAGHQSSVNP